MFKYAFKLLGNGTRAVATGKAGASLGLQSPHTPGAIVRVGRFLYFTSGTWIAICWYSGYVNARTEPGSGPKLILPGSKKAIGNVSRPRKDPKFVTGGIVHDNSSASNSSNQMVTSPRVAGRTLVAISPAQLGTPGTATAGFLWSAPDKDKQIPAFDRARYQGLLGIANHIARAYGLTITSGYRPTHDGSLHAAGIAFDMVGSMSQMKRAATWAASNPSLFQEIFIHNEGSGLHLHLGFYPDAAGIYNAGVNRMVRHTDRRQVNPV